jgi:hypothetical protein
MTRRFPMFVAALIAGAVAALSFPPSTSPVKPTTSHLERTAPTRSQEIRVDARYRQVPGRKLAVTQAPTSTVIASLMSGRDALGVVPAGQP